MTITELAIPTLDGTADAFAAFPDDGATHPGVLLYMDAIGLRPVLRDMAAHLADAGYYVLVPNVFYRHGPAPVVEPPDLTVAENRAPFFERIGPVIRAHTTDRIHGDATAYLEFLTTRPDVSDGPVGVVGYCLGGVLAVRTAAAHPELVAAAAGFHPGALVTDDPDSPHLLASHINAELVLGLADGDFTPDALARLTTSLADAGVRYTCEVYPHARHGFTMADTAAFNPGGSRRHWDELLPLLARNLG